MGQEYAHEICGFEMMDSHTIHSLAVAYYDKSDYCNYVICLLESAGRDHIESIEELYDDNLLGVINMLRGEIFSSKFEDYLSNKNNKNTHDYYVFGCLIIRKDVNKGIEYFIMSIGLGNDRAAYHLGWIYENGVCEPNTTYNIIIQPNQLLAIQYYKQSANNNNVRAICALGRHCQSENNDMAMQYYKNAIEIYKINTNGKIYYRALKLLYELYKSTWPKYFGDAFKYLYPINQMKYIKDLYNVEQLDANFLAEMINQKKMIKELLKENKTLRKENADMKRHIDASPDGKFYYEAMESWNDNLAKKSA
jgi:hypothetical protein